MAALAMRVLLLRVNRGSDAGAEGDRVGPAPSAAAMRTQVMRLGKPDMTCVVTRA